MYTYTKYDDPRGKYGWEATGGYLFKTEAEAASFCQAKNDYFVAMEPLRELPRELSREEYEVTCTRLNVPAMSDQECTGYGVKYGEYTSPEYSPQHCVKMALARRRLNALEVERKARPKRERQPDYPDGRQLDCGCIIYWHSEIMNASLGTSCQDCYDRMSD